MKNIIAFSILTISTGLLGVEFYLQLNKLQEQNTFNTRVAETKSLLLNLQNLSNQAYNQASVYLLTRNPDNLNSFKQAKETIKDHYSKLISMGLRNTNTLNESADLSKQTLFTLDQLLASETFNQQEANILVLTLEMNKVILQKLNSISSSIAISKIDYKHILKLILASVLATMLVNGMMFFIFLKNIKSNKLKAVSNNFQLDIAGVGETLLDIKNLPSINKIIKDTVKELQTCNRITLDTQLSTAHTLETLTYKNERIIKSLETMKKAAIKMPNMLRQALEHITDKSTKQEIKTIISIVEQIHRVIPFYIKIMANEKEKCLLSIQTMNEAYQANNKTIEKNYSIILEQNETLLDATPQQEFEMKLCA